MKKPHSVNIYTYAQQDTPVVKFPHSVNILILLICASSTQQDTPKKNHTVINSTTSTTTYKSIAYPTITILILTPRHNGKHLSFSNCQLSH